jgi:predicted transcriptional regulator
MSDTLTRDNLRQTVKDRHLNAAALARLTGKSQRAVRSYLEGTRRPSDEWVQKVGQIVAALDEVAA